MNISLRLKRVVEISGMSITGFAEKCGVPYSSMQNYLRGEREPKVDALVSISSHMGISIDWLLTGEGAMYKSAPPTHQQPALTPKERALLALFKELNDKDQREICQDAEDKKRLADMEQQIKAMALKLEQLNSTG